MKIISFFSEKKYINTPTLSILLRQAFHQIMIKASLGVQESTKGKIVKMASFLMHLKSFLNTFSLAF